MRSAIEATVVIPMFNEAPDIAGCIESLAAQDMAPGALELILVDGGSDDSSARVAVAAAERLGLAAVAVVENPARRTSCGLNLGLAAARGEVLVRVDARSRVEPHYVRTCVERLRERADIGVVGGAQIARARSDSPVAVGIARALRNRWATGLSRYRRAVASGPCDTVWMGAFRARELRDLGGWDEAVALNEDFELNERYRANGFVVWFEASLRSGYLPRTSLAQLVQQYFLFGRIKGTWWSRGRCPTPRQALLMLAPPVGAGMLVLASRRTNVTASVLAGVLGVALIDAAGGDRSPAGLGERLCACTAVVSIGAAWWTGVWAGIVGELLGLEHRHGRR